MLFATTRNNHTVETAYKVIHADCASDGGLFVPFRMSKFTNEELNAFADRSFGENMAQILNIFFSCGLTGWDLEFCIGRAPVKMNTITHKILIAEAWHNNEWKFDHVIQTVSDRLRKEGIGDSAGNWVGIAVRIAAMFGIYGQLRASGQLNADTVFDVAVTSGDFAAPMAAWYAREMGLPVGNIVCGCNANGGVWDLLHRGEFSTSAVASKTTTPEVDIALPRNLERLVYGTLGLGQTQIYLDHCHRGAMYVPEPELFEKLRKGMFAAVISDSRVKNIIHSVYRTSNYVFSPYAALAYGSLLDYRAKTGESRAAILICDRSPICDSELVAASMGVAVPELIKRIQIS